MTKKGIFIFRRDYRLQDNTALYKAMDECEVVIPLFIFTPEQVERNSYKSNNAVLFMIECLEELESQIKSHNGKLYIYKGKNQDIIEKLLSKNEDVCGVYVNKDYSYYSKKRDRKIEKVCKKYDVDFKSYHDECLYPPQSIRTTTDQVYSKFTPFYNNVIHRNVDKPVSRRSFPFSNRGFTSIKEETTLEKARDTYTTPNEDIEINGGRDNALKKIRSPSFEKYDEKRDQFDYDTTKMSAYIKFGVVSIREVYHRWKQHYGLKSGLVRQLLWRDFYFHILDDNPQLMKGKSFRENYDDIKWENNRSYFNSWKEGKTGYPIVDACMRHLNKTGYMPNRGRLIVSSFLIKTLLIDWKEGEKYFATQLTDYDPASNNGNWQWMSGSGADSQPYFRIFNPLSQGKRFDKDANYIKKWIPELKDVEPKHIHEWNKYYEEYPDLDYPEPIVDYSVQREKVMKMYKSVV